MATAPVPVSTLPPFSNAQACCAKCGARRLIRGDRVCSEVVDGEHFHRVCTTCGHRWIERSCAAPLRHLGAAGTATQTLDRTAREVVTNQPGEEPPNGYGRHMRSPVNIGTIRYGRLYAANFHGRGDAQLGTGLPSSSAKIISIASVSAPA